MTTFSKGTVRKRRDKSGNWQWQGVLVITEGEGSSKTKRTVTKALGVPCDPKTEEEKGQGRRSKPGGRGYKTACDLMEKWRASVVAKCEQEAAERALRTEGTNEDAARPNASALHVPAYIDYYIESRATGSEGVQASTEDNYHYAARHLNRPELDVPIAELTADDVQAWVKATAREGVGSSIRARSFSLLKYALDYAIGMGHRTAANPTAPIKAPVANRRDPNPLDDENLQQLNTILDRLLERRPDRRTFADAVKLAVLTAMRQGELCGLRWCDVDGWRTGDFHAGAMIHVNKTIANAGSKNGGYYIKGAPKNGSRREVPMNDDLAGLLRDRLAYSQEQCVLEGVPFTGEMFVLGVPSAEKGKGYLSPNYLGKQWRSFVDMTDLVGREGLTPHFHDLRHTAATHMLRTGIPVQTVAGILGHKNAGTTWRFYSKFLEEDAVRAMQAMNGKMTERAPEARVIGFKPTGTEG